MADEDADLSLNAWAVLTLLVDDGAQHGFALSKALGRSTDVGRVWSVPRSLVYRALDQLERRGLAVAGPEVPSDAGPRRQEYAATPAGVAAVVRWRQQPVEHLREVRPDLILKLTLSRRAGVDLEPLLTAQKECLAPLRDALRAGGEPDGSRLVVDVWREELALAVDRTIDRLLEPGSRR